MPENQNNIDDQLLRDWAEMKKLQHPKYWMRMKHRLEITIQRKRKIRIARYAALFMLPILGGGLYFLLNGTHPTSPQVEQTLAKILPGEKKATLYTSFRRYPLVNRNQRNPDFVANERRNRLLPANHGCYNRNIQHPRHTPQRRI